MEQLTLNVTGMTCGGCENAVRRVVSTIDGVTSVTPSHKENRVVVDYDGAKATREQIERAIRQAGYTIAA